MLSQLTSAVTSAVSTALAAPGNALGAVLKPMDTVFNIPLVSVLLLPSLSSWSTSFNVLFFYATWSLLLLSHGPLAVEFLGTLAVRAVFYAAPCALFLALDAVLPFVMRSLKRHGGDGIATAAGNGGLGRRGRWWRVVALALANLLLGAALQTGVDWLLTDVLRTRSALRITSSLPMPWGIIKHLVGGYVLREVLSYVGHRYVLHAGTVANGNGAGNVLCKHSSAYHRYFYHHLHTPLPFSAHFDHPLPYLVRVWAPTYIPAALLRFHLLTYHLWLAMISIEEALVYSNYDTLPTGLILGGMARRAERHLISGGTGNYGAYGLMDLLMGTSLGDDDVIDDVTEEAQRRDLPQRARRKGRAIREAAAEIGDDVQTEVRQRRSTRKTRSKS